MKKILLSLILGFVFSTSLTFAEAQEDIKDIDLVIADIMSSQNVSTEEDVDCDVAKDKDLEELGESVMQKMTGSNEAHEIMDKMMGGEGSKELKNAHIKIGKQYLGCLSYGYGMMGNYLSQDDNDNYRYGMMQSYLSQSADDIYETYRYQMMGWPSLRFAGFALFHLIGIIIFVPFIIYLSSKAWHKGINAANKKKKS